MTDRGVSEVLGYVLIFALVTGTIGIVYGTGLNGLDRAQNEEKIQNLERAFDVLADNLDHVANGNAPSRATEVKLAGGSLSIEDTVSITIYAENKTNPLDNTSYRIDSKAITYEDDNGDKLVYVAGAVLREQSDGAVMLHEPDWIIRPDRSVIPLVNTFGGNTSNIAGSGKVLIVAEQGSKTLQSPFPAGSNQMAVVNVTITSPRVSAWKRYFEDQERFSAMEANVNNNNVTYRFDTEKVYVPKTDIKVTFNR